jgi:beta-N-acetylhexosaminidase
VRASKTRSDSPSPTPEPPGPADLAGLRTGWGPSERELDRAVRGVRRLSLPELAGQVIVADWSGTSAPVAMVRDLHLGGVIAFTGNVASARQVRAVNRTLARRVPRDWPLFLSVDEEGGIVERLDGVATRLPAFMAAGAADDTTLTRSTYAALGGELRGLGFTVDFAPDADVTSGPDDPTIGSRSAGSDPARVGRHVTASASGLVRAGVVPVLKHFPGHGSVTDDSHHVLPVQRRSVRKLARTELRPFAEAIDTGLPAVMTGHLDVRAVDPGVPSSLSRKVTTGMLRRDLGFEGLVVTDSLEMGAVTRSHDSARSAVAALRAGADVVLMPPDPAAARAGIIRAVRSGALSRARLRQAAARQVALLEHLRSQRGSRPGTARRASRRLSAAATTLVSGPCRGRLSGRDVLPVGDTESVAAFVPAARAAGLTVVDRWRPGVTTVGFSGYADGPYAADVAVATDTPYVLGRSSAKVRIATYGATDGAMRALADVLLGRERARGRLPVRVPGVRGSGVRCGRR